MSLPSVAIASTGGTITMTADSSGTGVGPTLGARDLISAVPTLAQIAQIQTTTLATMPGASLSFTDVLAALSWARSAVAGGAAGAVLIQGTDTLEETAYLLDLHWDRPEPLVLTGAMRPPATAGADGPANLLAAVLTATAASSRSLGALVVMNDQVHAASRVRKTDSISVDAFDSPNFGALGRLREGAVIYGNRPRRWPHLPQPDTAAQPRVALLDTCLGDEGELLRLVLADGYDGVVVAGFGAGHVAHRHADVIAEAAQTMPVVLASRTGAGTTLSSTYGFAGSESDLLTRGALPAGWLDPRKARLLLWSLLAVGAPTATIAEEFARRGESPGGPP